MSGKNIYDSSILVLMMVGSVISEFLGGWDGYITALLVLMSVDFFTGVLVGIKEKEVSSAKAKWGFSKKLVVICLVGVAATVDNVMQAGGSLRTAALLYYVASEGMSLVENCSKLGVPIPGKLQNVFEQLKKSSDEDKEEKSA